MASLGLSQTWGLSPTTQHFAREGLCPRYEAQLGRQVTTLINDTVD